MLSVCPECNMCSIIICDVYLSLGTFFQWSCFEFVLNATCSIIIYQVIYPRYHGLSVTVQNSGYNQFPPAINGWRIIHLIPVNGPTTPDLRVGVTNLKRTNPRNNSQHHFSTLRLALADGTSNVPAPQWINIARSRPREAVVLGAWHEGT
jgi:hypothetical protein